jgi:ribose transport system ATP-binding protein
MPSTEAALRVERLSKSFAGTPVLQDLSLAVPPGEIRALLGGNGSGKSTLLMILAGVYHAQPGGEIIVNGLHTTGDRVTPRWARAAGLRFVHQELGLFPDLSVAENLAIGSRFDIHGAGTVDWRGLRRRTRAALDRFEIAADPTTRVRSLSPDDRAMLAVARAFEDHDEARRVYVLDEPTAALSAPKARLVYDVLRASVADGAAALFVTHRLDEVIAVADAATILRDGSVVGTRPHDELDPVDLAQLIAGSRVAPARSHRRVSAGPAVLEVQNLTGGPVDDLSFALLPGEILGIAGPLGAGHSELLQMLFGRRVPERGTVLLDGTPVRFEHVSDAMRAGVAYVPHDRTDGAFPGLSLAANFSVASTRAYWRRLQLQRGREMADARRWIAELDIKASSPRQEMATVSGGNQQKTILARWLQRAPRVLLLDEPTRGVDISSRVAVHALLADLAAGGAGVIVVSDDFDELSAVADRVLVIVGGRIAAELRQPGIDAARIAGVAFHSPASV